MYSVRDRSEDNRLAALGRGRRKEAGNDRLKQSRLVKRMKEIKDIRWKGVR